MAQSLHVIDDRRAHVETHSGREIGWFDPGLGALAFQRFDQPCFFTTDIGAGTTVDVEVATEVTSTDVVAKESRFAGFRDGIFDNLCGLWKLFANVDVCEFGTDCEAGDDHALDELVRVLMDNVAILEGPRFGLVAVTDQVDRFLVAGRDESPFHTCWKTGATSAPEARLLYFFRHLPGGHLKGLLQSLVATVGEISLQGRVPAFPVYIPKDQPVLVLVGFFPFDVGYLCHPDRLLVSLKQVGCLLCREIFVKVIINEAHRCTSAGGEAFCEFH